MRSTTPLPLTATLCLAVLASRVAAQIGNPDFEDGLGPPPEWTVVTPVAAASDATDAGMPTSGQSYLTMLCVASGPASPHDTPGGFGAEATGTTSVEQAFVLPSAGASRLEFDCVFMSNDLANNDFLEASVTALGATLNLIHLDAADAAADNQPSSTGRPATTVRHVSVDLGALFPAAEVTTPFTVRLHCGNRVDTTGFSYARFDDFRLTPGTPVADVSVAWSVVNNGATILVQVQTLQPFAQFFDLVSPNVAGAVGGGPILGLYPDIAIFQILVSPIPTPTVHDLTDATGSYAFSFAAGLVPPALVFDYVLVEISPIGAIHARTDAQRFDLAAMLP